ncbi:MAG: class I SAM-dependent methyltransferase [Cyanobacteria bacterium J06555_13]
MDTSSDNTAYAWFDSLYTNAGEDVTKVPWAMPGALPALKNWLNTSEAIRNKSTAIKSTAVVVGCGLGDDAEAIAQAGYSVTAFDVSPQAIAWAKKRFPHTTVNYVAADLFNLPEAWKSSFDLAFDFRTIQALPISLRTDCIKNIANLGKSGGTVLIATYLRGEGQNPGENPPWPLSEQELAHFETLGLEKVREERSVKKESRFSNRTLTQYRVP